MTADHATADRVGTVTLRIDSIAAGGDGVGRADGLAVFVPRSAPGDVAQVRLAHHGRFARGTLLNLESPSADRVDPPCTHFTRDKCGGCQLQHISYEAQLGAKARIVSDAMARIGHRPVSAPTITPSPQWRYRRKLTLALHRLGDETWLAGLHPFDAPASIFALEDCPITEVDVLTVWRKVLASASLLPRARRLRASVQISDSGASLTVEGAGQWSSATAMLEAVSEIDSVFWMPEGGRRRRVAQRTSEHTGARSSFTQVNAVVAKALHERVVARVLEAGPATVVDAYAGSGETSVAIAAAGIRVTAIELDPEAARYAATLLPTGSRSIVGRVERELASTLPADVVVLNPPRAGVHEDVTTLLDGSTQTTRIVYVSCNPATLARDIARMSAYEITATEAFDMFPQTAHVETLCVLDRSRREPS